MSENIVARWYAEGTPEQRQELERIARTVPDMVEGLNRATDIIVPGLRKVQGWMESPEGKAILAHFEGLALLVETFNELQDNPVIQGSPLAADFVRSVLDEFDKMPFSDAPSELLASVQAPKIEQAARKESSRKAIAARHAGTKELKARIIAEMRKHETGPRWKTPAARKVAPLAFQWNNEARTPETRRTPYNWPDIDKAQQEIRRWLDK